jgi:hypothetical protein
MGPSLSEKPTDDAAPLATEDDERVFRQTTSQDTTNQKIMFYSSVSPLRSAREQSATRALLRSSGNFLNDGRIEKLWPLLVAGVLLLGGCAGNIHTRVTEDLEVKTEESTTQVQWTRNGHTTELTMQGDVTIAGSLDDIQSVPADGHFELTETNGRTQRLRVVPAEGTAEEDRLSYRYTVDGQSKSFGKEERRWLRRTLHEVARKTGIGVEQRVAYLFEKGGADAVFEEWRRVDSDVEARHYYSALIRLDAAPMTVADRALRRATHRLDSDFQKRHLLEEVADRYVGAPDHFDAYEEAVRTIDSDYQKRQLLTALTPSALPGAQAPTLSHVVGMVDSEYHQRQAFAELLGRDDLPANQLVALLEQVQKMESGRHKTKLLREAENLYTHDDPAVREAYREAAVSIVATEDS